MDTVGFIGLGRMGRPMASNLCRKGFSLIVYDINSEPIDAVAQLGAERASGMREVSSASDVVLTMLPDSRIVHDVIVGTDGVLAHAKPGTLVVDMSTIDPLVDGSPPAGAKQCSFAERRGPGEHVVTGRIR